MGDDESSRRLLRLEDILAADFVAGSTRTGRTGPSNTALDRIVRLAGQLQGRVGFEQDAVDLLNIRLLLNEYVSVLADLRALAASAEEHLEKALSSLKDERCSRARRLLAGARRKSDSNSLLQGRTWESIAVPREALDTISMLSDDEKRFLYWCTAEYYDDKGEIVELGPFAGGSSVALAAGLRAGWPATKRRVKVYDRFITDDYIDEFYLKPNGLAALSGRFRHVYDKQTAAFADRLAVHEGDVMHEGWDGCPIEILFIDCAKTWRVNDHVNRTFLPHLIPGTSLVIQQDFFHQWECWTILTMELLSDYFEYVGFVRWNTAVYRCTRAIPLAAIPEDLRDLGLDRLRSLLDAQVARHTDPYLRGMLTAALIALLRDFGAHSDAQELAGRALQDFSTQPIVIEAIRQFGATL